MNRHTASPEPRKRLLDAIAEYHEGEWGFTGTRAGMTAFQLEITHHVLKVGYPLVFRHGAAFGSDTEAHGAWRDECKNVMADVWPADEKRAAIYRGQKNVHVQPVMPPLDRNIEIVKRSRFLVATPHTEAEVLRSGTWQTIREGLKINMPILIIWPFTKRITFYFEKKLHRVTYTD